MVIWLAVGWFAFALLAVPWALAHLGLARWVRRARLDPPATVSWTAPLRIVVPARDEQVNIAACIEALRQLPPGPWQAVIVDDASQDQTREVARAAIDGHPAIRLVSAPERPTGWAGKAWACQHGAVGEEPWLLFLDADVRIDPRAPAALVGLAAQEGRDLLSAFGTWTLGSLAERVLMPAFGWVIRGSIDAVAVREGRLAFANGQCLLIRRATYAAIGGHRAVADAILDDVGLARAVRAAAGRLDVRFAPWAFQVRPYRTIPDILRGHHKNLHVGLGRGVAVSLLAALALIGLGLGPATLVAAAWSVGLSGLTLAAATLVFGQVLLRWRLERLDGRAGVLEALLHPIAVAVVGLTLAASAVWPRATWRGRTYVDGRATDA